MNNTVITDCVHRAIQNQATKIVNEYIEFWKTDISQYKIEHLHLMYYYLMSAHYKKIIDIFCYKRSIYYDLFLI